MRLLILLLSLLYFSALYSQEIVLKTKFSIRDFKINDNTIVYIEKRDIKNVNLISKKEDSLIKKSGYFIGGYGLNIYYPKTEDFIITSSNEWLRNRSSIRFYNIKTKAVDKYNVLYKTELMDFLLLPEKKMFFLSEKKHTIEVYKYGGKPRYKLIDKINLNSFARKLRFKNNKLYYITDSGKLFQYDIENKENKLIYEGNVILTNFVFDNESNNIYITTFNGKLIKVEVNNSFKNKEIFIGDTVIEALNIQGDFIITGDWNGAIKLIEKETLEVQKEFKIKKRIIKIRVQNNNVFYTSSADKTLRRWNVE
jgi:WD40 repeat protein